jgi:hypothetical protein
MPGEVAVACARQVLSAVHASAAARIISRISPADLVWCEQCGVQRPPKVVLFPEAISAEIWRAALTEWIGPERADGAMTSDLIAQIRINLESVEFAAKSAREGANLMVRPFTTACKP